MVTLLKVAYYYSTTYPPYVKEWRKVRFEGVHNGLYHNKRQQRAVEAACETFISSVPPGNNDLEVVWKVQFPPELDRHDQEYALAVLSDLLRRKGKMGSFDNVSIDRETNPLPEGEQC